MVKTAVSVSPLSDLELMMNVSAVRDKRLRNWAPKMNRPKLIILVLRRIVKLLIVVLKLNWPVLLRITKSAATGIAYESENKRRNCCRLITAKKCNAKSTVKRSLGAISRSKFEVTPFFKDQLNP